MMPISCTLAACCPGASAGKAAGLRPSGNTGWWPRTAPNCSAPITRTPWIPRKISARPWPGRNGGRTPAASGSRPRPRGRKRSASSTPIRLGPGSSLCTRPVIRPGGPGAGSPDAGPPASLSVSLTSRPLPAGTITRKPWRHVLCWPCYGTRNRLNRRGRKTYRDRPPDSVRAGGSPAGRRACARSTGASSRAGRGPDGRGEGEVERSGPAIKAALDLTDGRLPAAVRGAARQHADAGAGKAERSGRGQPDAAARRRGRRGRQQPGELAEVLGVGGLVLPDRDGQRLGGIRSRRPADAGRRYGHLRPCRRGGGAGRQARAADQETEPGTDAHGRSAGRRCARSRLTGNGGSSARRPQQRRELVQLLSVGGAVLLDRGGERLLIGVDELLLVAGLDGEVDPGQVRGLGAVSVGGGRRDLRLVGGGAYRFAQAYLMGVAVDGLPLLEDHGLRLVVAVAVLHHAGGPGVGGVLHRWILQDVIVDVVAQRLDAGQRPVLRGVGEVLEDRGALADRGLLRLREAGRVRARLRGVDAQGAQRGAGEHPEAVLLRLGDSQVAPSSPRLRERQGHGSDVDRDRGVAAVRVARGVHARVGERVTRLVGRQPVVVGLAERGVGGERLAGQRRLDRGGWLWPADTRRAHGGVRALGRAGGAAGQARATADQQAEVGAETHSRSFLSNLTRAAAPRAGWSAPRAAQDRRPPAGRRRCRSAARAG